MQRSDRQLSLSLVFRSMVYKQKAQSASDFGERVELGSAAVHSRPLHECLTNTFDTVEYNRVVTSEGYRKDVAILFGEFRQREMRVEAKPK